MKDIHSHLLYKADDGTKTREETINLLNLASEVGFTEMVMTPHYYKEYNFIKNNKEKEMKLNRIKHKMKLHLGNEVYFTNDIIKLLKEKKITTINNTKYLLIEFPFDIYFKVFKEWISDLNEKGIIPIIAHPERYAYYQHNPERIKELLKLKVVIQCNYGSIIGLYGRKSKKCLKKLLKMGVVDVFSLDLHSDPKVLNKFKVIKRKIIRKTSEEKFKEFSDTNIEKIINSEKINIENL